MRSNSTSSFLYLLAKEKKPKYGDEAQTIKSVQELLTTLMPKQKYERKISNCKHGDEEPKAKTEDHFKPLVKDTE